MHNEIESRVYVPVTRVTRVTTPLTNIHNTSYDISNSYYASCRYTNTQSAVLDHQISTAANKGLISRYWGTSAWPISIRDRVWRMLVVEIGMGMLNVDDLKAAGDVESGLVVEAGLSICYPVLGMDIVSGVLLEYRTPRYTF
jgi:hypothetical protein